MSTKQDNILNPASCWNRALPDEPVFILKATDETAPETIKMWAARYMMAKGGWSYMKPEQRAKYNEALGIAARMTEWRNKSLAANTFDDDIPF